MIIDLTVRIGAITFGGGPDVDGDRFVLGDIDGWESAGVSLVTVDRPFSDGVVIVRGRRTARALVLSGHGIATTPDAVWNRVRHKLTTAFDLVTADGTLYVDEPAGTYSLAVRLAAPLRVAPDGPYAVEFEASLIAANPAKTGPT